MAAVAIDVFQLSVHVGRTGLPEGGNEGIGRQLQPLILFARPYRLRDAGGGSARQVALRSMYWGGGGRPARQAKTSFTKTCESASVL
jgi:hypothetical protein